jgi:glycosyltransferase involved in cell wall biosynthesis
VGIEYARYPWVCYLDTDDEFMPGHLQTIVDNIDDAYDWVYFDDQDRKGVRTSKVIGGQIGTSCIAHKKDINAHWPDGYSHDWRFIETLGPRHKKIPGSGYQVHHIPTQYDQ